MAKRWYINPVVLDNGVRKPKVATYTFQDGTDADGEPIFKHWFSHRSIIMGRFWIAGEIDVKIGDRRVSDGNIYVATTNGTTGTVAPTGTGTDIDDGGVLWGYVAPDVAISLVSPIPGTDFSLLEADAECIDVIQEIREARGRDLENGDRTAWYDMTPGQIGLNQGQLNRILNKMTDFGADTTGLTLDTTLGVFFTRLADLINFGLDVRQIW